MGDGGLEDNATRPGVVNGTQDIEGRRTVAYTLSMVSSPRGREEGTHTINKPIEMSMIPALGQQPKSAPYLRHRNKRARYVGATVATVARCRDGTVNVR